MAFSLSFTLFQKNMREFIKIKVFIIVIFSLCIFSNNAFAAECYEKSKNLINLKDDYYNLDPKLKISGKDRELLNK